MLWTTATGWSGSSDTAAVVTMAAMLFADVAAASQVVGRSSARNQKVAALADDASDRIGRGRGVEPHDPVRGAGRREIVREGGGLAQLSERAERVAYRSRELAPVHINVMKRKHGFVQEHDDVRPLHDLRRHRSIH